MSESTGLVKRESTQSTALDDLRRSGQAAVARQREINALFKAIESMKWGSVQGSKLSEGSRYALARMCHATQADPTVDIDILGGNPYHNATYYRRRAMNHPGYVKHELRNILHDQEARQQYGVPEDALAAYETVITRLTDLAVSEVRAGRLPLKDAMDLAVEVRAANWAGNKRKKKRRGKWDDVNRRYGPGEWYEVEDTIGMAEPDKTARTRSFRRCACDAFGLEFMGEQEVIRAQRVIEADWEYADSGTRKADVAAGEVVVGHGEPAAEDPGLVDVETGEIHEPEPDPEPPVDLNEKRREFFATLGAVGLKPDKKRKAFMAEHGLPDSVTQFTESDYERALDAIMSPLRDRVLELCKQVGTTVGDVSLQELQMATPEYAKDWVYLRNVLELRASRLQQEQGEQDDAPDEQSGDGPPAGLWGGDAQGSENHL
ncbi:MAG: hypothetical protein OXH66_10005 [Gemmatimonadetes bacterium]|nr:hypothetical protein [Gemmatimonadota bacterium]